MKTLLKMFAGVFLLSLLTITSEVFAQADTVDITPLPPGNINNVIVGDTLAGGVRANPDRVYRLERGRVYQVTQPLRINGSFKIIATEPVDGQSNRPPVLAPAILEDNSSVDHFFDLVGKGANVELSDIYVLSIRSDQVQLGWSDGIRVSADSIKLKMDGVILDGFSHRGISLTGQWSKMTVQNSHFRNHKHGSSYFGGAPFESDSPVHMDTCIFKNNTFFSNNATNFTVRGFDRYSVFEHNTIAYGTVYPFLVRQASNLHMKNNLFYSIHSHGGIPEHVQGTWFLNYPDTVSSSIIHIRTRDSVSAWYQHAMSMGASGISGPDVYVDEARGVTADMLRLEDRVYDISNNAYFWPQALKDFYTSYNDTVATFDSVETAFGSKVYLKRTLTFPKWITEYSQWAFDNLISPVADVNMSNNSEADPGFNTDVSNHINDLIDYVRKIATGTLDTPWFYTQPGVAKYPPVWPLPENLRYTNTALVGDDGLPLGDLNWFPELVDVKRDNDLLPMKYTLSEAYPNPFNPTTNFKFSIPKAGNVTLVVYNLLGQKVKTLYSAELTAGSYEAKWDGTNDFGAKVTSGVYFYRLEAGTFSQTKKMVMMK